MRKNVPGFLLSLIALVTLTVHTSVSLYSQQEHSPYYVVVLSLDGVRWDQPDHVQTPHLDMLAAGGVRAEAFIPVFPTGTFANHYSMATGLYPDHHGIVANRFYCAVLDENYNKSNRESVRDGKFYGGEPIWVTAGKHGLKTASFFWVGSEADVQGVRPDYWKAYQGDFPYGDRIDTVIHWLNLPHGERPHLITWYYHQVDSDGHWHGPLGEKTLSTLAMKDSLIGVFLAGIDTLPHRDSIHFIVVSDHGMTDISPERHINLDEHVDTAFISFFDGSTAMLNIKAAEGKLEELYEGLQAIDHVSVWKAGELPERLNYGHHPRVNDMVILADPGWTIGWSWRNYTMKGNHGYDNLHPDMHGIFYATGPMFREGHVAPALENLHLYVLIARLLGIDPSESDADIRQVENMLKAH